MKVAVPLFGNDVAPRFRYADRILISEIVKERIVAADHVGFDYAGWPFRLGLLKEHGVDVILCCGFNCSFTPLAESLGIKVVTGFNGVAEEAVEAFARGEKMSTSQRDDVGQHAYSGRNRRRAGKRGRGHRGGRGNNDS